MAKKKTVTYDSAKTYSLAKITQTVTETSPTEHTVVKELEGITNLTTPNAIVQLQKSAIEGENATANEIMKEMKNYAYFALRNAIETAANSGQSYVDVDWHSLIQSYSESKLITFLGIVENDDGSFQKWPADAGVPLTSAWGSILNEINKNQSPSVDIVAVGYLYDTNDEVPYAVRLSWRDSTAGRYTTSDVNDATNLDIKAAKDAHPYFIIEDSATTFIDDDTAITQTADGASEAGQALTIQQIIDLLNNKINAASISGDNYTKIFWNDINQVYRESIVKFLLDTSGDHKGDKLYMATKAELNAANSNIDLPPRATKTIKSEVVIYADSIKATASKVTIAKNTSVHNFLSYLFSQSIFNKYAWQWLLNHTTETIDGIVVAWGSNAQSVANTQRGQYKTDTTPEAPDDNVYIDAPTIAELNDSNSTITKAIHTKHLTAFINQISSGLIQAYNSLDAATPILWTVIDGALASNVAKLFYRTDVLSYSGPIYKPAETEGGEATLLIKANGRDKNNNRLPGYAGGIYAIFGSFRRVHHSVSSVSESSSDADITVKFNDVTGLNANTIYWDYLYYKNRFGTWKVEDGKVKWAKKTDQEAGGGGATQLDGIGVDTVTDYGKPCGIVVQVGSSSDHMKAYIKDYANTPDPSVSYSS